MCRNALNCVQWLCVFLNACNLAIPQSIIIMCMWYVVCAYVPETLPRLRCLDSLTFLYACYTVWVYSRFSVVWVPQYFLYFPGSTQSRFCMLNFRCASRVFKHVYVCFYIHVYRCQIIISTCLRTFNHTSIYTVCLLLTYNIPYGYPYLQHFLWISLSTCYQVASVYS